MKSMTDMQAYLFFAFFVCAQVSAFRRRWNLPHLRGDEWFLGVKVEPDFCDGPGRPILRWYRLAMLAPYALELAAITAILIFGRPYQLMYLAAAMAFAITFGHMAIAWEARRRARRLEVPGSGQPVSSVMFSLKPRRVADYTTWKLEYTLAALNAGSLAYLAYLYSSAPWPHTLHAVFGKPILLLYLQVGLVLAKRALVAWRTVAPRENAEQYLEWREHTRRLWVYTCDSVRALWAFEMVRFAVREAIGPPWDNERVNTILLLASLLIYAGWAVWYTRRRNAYLAVVGRTRPVKLPDSLDGRLPAPRLVCYLPDHPVLLVKGAHGYALNLASGRTQMGALYLMGLATVYVWVRMS